ncbi:MAG: type II TA system antitoxin MqsA family protein [Opitutaceae bacterium]|jgi:putative zinc finger/helix-turn-helix YgiT family protein
MKTNRKPRRLVCLKCEQEAFTPAEGEVTQEFRGETLRVRTPVMRCAHCGWETLGPGQVDALRVATADAYRRAHGLLTSVEIRAVRESAGLSQRAFAAALNVGPASIPRWESWQVQESAYDDRIRRFAERCAWQPLPTLHLIAQTMSLPTTPTPEWQEEVWVAMAHGLRSANRDPMLPGAERWSGARGTKIMTYACLMENPRSSQDIEFASIKDDSLCAYA